jgi:signal transduction histidine kinase
MKEAWLRLRRQQASRPGAALPSHGVLGHLTPGDQPAVDSRGGGRSLETAHVEELRGTIDGLRREVAELRAARKRLVVAADADRREIERELHEGVQQHLVALAVNLQLLSELMESDPPAAMARVAELGRDVQLALDEAAHLAQRIHPPLLEAAGLAVALRAAGATTSVDVPAGASYPVEVTAAVYWCCLEVLEHAGAGSRTTVAVREQDGALIFEIEGEGVAGAGLEPLRDRVEALGGELTIRSDAGRGTRISGSLPVSESR